ncbi:MAG: ADOP family duplicated permease [Gemmatimonadaceae bacterium]
MIKRFVRRLRTVFTPGTISREIEEEMALHIAMERDDLIAQGIERDEAWRRARAAFGGVDRYVDEARDAWALRGLQSFAADLRFAARSLRHSPSFTVTVVFALALAMGANATVFGAVDSAAFRPLAVHDPASLVAIYGNQGEANLLGFSYPTYQDIRRTAAAFSDVLAFTEGPVNVTLAKEPAAVWAMHTSDNYFSMLGVRPRLGRFYKPGDLMSPAVVLSDGFWASAFGRDPRIVGRTLAISGRLFTVSAVAPAQFTGTRLFTFDPAIWIPIGSDPQTMPASAGVLTRRTGRGFQLIGRLRDGVSIAQARTSVDATARRLADAFPDQYGGLRMTLLSNRTPINPWLAPRARIEIVGRLLLIGALFVLLICCVNISSLSIARMTVRSQEIAVRLSLGASRGRLVQQLLTESLLLAALGAVASVPVSVVASHAMQGLVPHLEYASTLRPASDARMLVYSALMTVGAALVFGLGPAVQSSEQSLVDGLHDRGGRGGLKGTRLREAMVIGQALISALVLVIGGLFVRSLEHARRSNPGFALDGAVAFTLNPQLSPEYDTARTRAFYARLDASLASIRGVRSVARAASLPLDGNSIVRRVFTADSPLDATSAPTAELNVVTPRYFATLGTPIVEGREFLSTDIATPGQGVVVNEVLARRLWPGSSAIGKRLRLGSPTRPEMQVIGVARVSFYRAVGERPRGAVWVNLDRNPIPRTTTLVRVTGQERTFIEPVRAALSRVDPKIPVMSLGTLREFTSVSYSALESGAVAAIGFGALALVLAASGVYGLTAYAVSQRRREIAIRLAVGAQRRSVIRLVAGRALTLTLIGAGMGALIAAFVPMGLKPLLFGVTQHDPSALVAAMIAFGTVAFVAALVAAWRAMKLDPMTVLRLD